MYSYKNCYGLSFDLVSYNITSLCIRTRIVMVYQNSHLFLLLFIERIRTRIVMVYRKMEAQVI